MKIKKIISQYRRDFTAIYICEHCNHEHEGEGYDDSFFHAKVIPHRACPKCGKKSPESYTPRATKYYDSETI
jgi:rubrerythrin